LIALACYLFHYTMNKVKGAIMQTLKLSGIALGVAMTAFLLSGCYTQFGIVARDSDNGYDDNVASDDQYYDDSETVDVIHYYPVPRHFSTAYFYYDPYDDWYWEPGVSVSFGFYYGPPYVYRPYPGFWYPPYGICPPPYVYGGWHYHDIWNYPPPYVIYSPPAGSPNFGRRPSYIAERERRTVDNGSGDRVYAPRSGSGGRTFTSLPKDDGGTYARPTDTVDRRKKTTDSQTNLVRRSSGNSRSNTTTAASSGSDSRRTVTRRSTGNSGSSTQSKAVRSGSSQSSGSSARPVVQSRASGSGSSSSVRSTGSGSSSSSRPSGSSGNTSVSSGSSGSGRSSGAVRSSGSGSSSSGSSSGSSGSRTRR